MRSFLRSVLAAFCVAALLSGCESGSVIDSLPGPVGLPAGAPERPAAPYKYPAVHDMPPPRATQPLSDEQQYKLERELQAARDRQEGRSATKKTTGGAKKQATGAK